MLKEYDPAKANMDCEQQMTLHHAQMSTSRFLYNMVFTLVQEASGLTLRTTC